MLPFTFDTVMKISYLINPKTGNRLIQDDIRRSSTGSHFVDKKDKEIIKKE